MPSVADFGSLVDTASFGTSPAEANTMDPQQRLLLVAGYAAIHGASMRRGDLLGREMGVSIGIMNTDFATLASIESMHAATGTQVSVASGRLSFALGLQGPCATIDTACSSALVSLDVALLSLRKGDSNAAMSAAVNLMLVPGPSSHLARAGMLSKDGRCKTLDACSNGYVRGEGVDAAQLGSMDGSGTSIVRSCAIRSDGKSASLTAPNGTAQALMIGAALAASGKQCVVLSELVRNARVSEWTPNVLRLRGQGAEGTKEDPTEGMSFK